MRHAALTGLGLVLLACLGVAAPGEEPSPFEAEIKAFEAADREKPPPEGAVLFVGSSSIRLWATLAEDFPGVRAINRGFGGSQVADSTRFADRIVLPYKPRQVVLYAGDNDIAAGKTPEQVLADFKAFVDKVHRALPEAKITYIAIKPSTARWHLVEQIREANRLIKALCDRPEDEGDRLAFADVFTPMLGDDGMPRKELLVEDGLHLSREGYRLWAEVLRPLVR